MAEKVVYHGATVVVDGNPPPYSGAPPPGPYGPPPGHYGPGPSVVHATMGSGVIPIVVAQQMGPQATRTVCKSCHAQIMTRVETKASMRTHLYAALLCLFGCWPCVCIPYCVDSCLNIDHYCPNCNSYLGSYIS